MNRLKIVGIFIGMVICLNKGIMAETTRTNTSNITTVIEGIHQPRGLYVNSKGDLYVTDVGSASPSLPWIEDGSVLVLRKDTNTIETVVSGLPSLLFEFDTLGLHDVYVDEDKDELFLLMGVSYNLLSVLNTDPTHFDPMVFVANIYDVRGFSLLKYNLSDVNSYYDKVVDFLDAEIMYNPDGEEIRTNPFKMRFMKNNIFVADAAANALWKVDDKRKITLFAGFDHFENPLADEYSHDHEGIEPVPTGIDIYKGDIYVSLFTGFPYIRGLSKVIKVDKYGNKTDFVTNLNWPIDIEFDENGDLFILEYASSFDLSHGLDVAAFKKDSGRIIKVSKKDSSITTIVEGINFPTDIAFDKDKRKIFISARKDGAGLRDLGKGVVYKVDLEGHENGD